MKPVLLPTLILLLSFLLGPNLSAQTEAQSSEEFMEFQNKQRPKSTTNIRMGNFVVTKADGEVDRLPDKGKVTGFTDSTIVVVDKQSGAERSINPAKVPRIKVVNRNVSAVGWAVFGVGALSSIPWGIWYISLTVSGYLGFVAVFLAAIFTNPFFWLGLGVAALLWIFARKTIFTHKWTWKRKRLITIKKKSR